jgi:hypothetical protein
VSTIQPLSDLPPLAAQDPEHGYVLREASTSHVMSLELAKPSPHSKISSVPDHEFAMDDTDDGDGDDHTTKGSCSLVSNSSSASLKDVGQKPDASILENDRATEHGRRFLQSAISSCGSTCQNAGEDSTDGKHFATDGRSILSGTTLPVDMVEDS